MATPLTLQRNRKAQNETSERGHAFRVIINSDFDFQLSWEGESQ
jgi:uncharacterized protein YaiE (UPF0345 family)